MLKTIFTIFTCCVLFSSPVLAKRYYRAAPAAVLYRPGNIFDKNIHAKKQSATQWDVVIFGNNVTSGERLETYANLRVALLGLKNGFSHFSLQPSKKSVLCRNRLMGTNSASPYIKGVASFATVAKGLYINAQDYINQYKSALMVDASSDEKSAVFADWTGRCP
jgi:hypothetical protein